MIRDCQVGCSFHPKGGRRDGAFGGTFRHPDRSPFLELQWEVVMFLRLVLADSWGLKWVKKRVIRPSLPIFHPPHCVLPGGVPPQKTGLGGGLKTLHGVGDAKTTF